MTVHKPGGSKCQCCSRHLNLILTRELVYTGTSRERDWLTLVESRCGMLDEAVTREVVRVSGLGRLR